MPARPQQIPRIRRSIAPRIGGQIGRNRCAVTRRYNVGIVGAKVNDVLIAVVSHPLTIVKLQTQLIQQIRQITTFVR